MRLALYYFNARWYDSNLGRFITEDPIMSGNNWYLYCSNNPLKFIDPTGLEEKTNYLVGDENSWYNEFCLEDAPVYVDSALKEANQYYWDALGSEPWWNIPTNAVNTVSFAATGVAAAFAPDDLIGLQELFYSGSLINQFSSLINASGTVLASKVTPFLSKFKNLFNTVDDLADDAVAKTDDILAQTDPYKGVKEASELLQNQGVHRNIRKQVLESFNKKSIAIETADDATYGLRFHDNGINAHAKGRYLFESLTDDINRNTLALPPEWNLMTELKRWKVNPFTKFIKGNAAPQLQMGPQYTGGAEQWYITDLSNLLEP